MEIVVSGECDAHLGWLIDYADITKAFQPIWEKLDHHYLNEVPGLENPTSENIAIWIWERLIHALVNSRRLCGSRSTSTLCSLAMSAFTVISEGN